MFLNKLGLTAKHVEKDATLIQEAIAVLQDAEIDMTIFFRKLADVDLRGLLIHSDEAIESVIAPLKEAY